MNRLLVAAACVALASCGKSEAPAEPAATTPAAEAIPPAAGAPTGEMAGTYEVKLADGTVVMETINADGTYVDTTGGKETAKGTWRVDGDKTCFDAEGDKPEACYGATPPGPDGSFRVIGADGKENGTTVRKVSAAPAAAPSAPTP